MSEGRAAGYQFALDKGDDVAISALDGDQGAGVEHEPHPALRRPGAAGRVGREAPGVRTGVARPRARRAAASISCAEIAPCSRSNAATNAASASSRPSCATFNRRASLTQALTLTQRPVATAASAAAIKSASTDADRRCLRFIRTCYHSATIVPSRRFACVAWSSAPRHLAPRDRFIGWSAETRRRHLRFVAYNTRFLILPWVTVPHLASHKGALFYNTLNGAHVGDLFMSLIHTCELNAVNPFAYLVALKQHAVALTETPAAGRLAAVDLPRHAAAARGVHRGPRRDRAPSVRRCARGLPRDHSSGGLDQIVRKRGGAWSGNGRVDSAQEVRLRIDAATRAVSQSV